MCYASRGEERTWAAVRRLPTLAQANLQYSHTHTHTRKSRMAALPACSSDAYTSFSYKTR